MLALNSAITAVVNSSIEITLNPYARWYSRLGKISAFQDGFIALEKWFRCGSIDRCHALPRLCGSQDTRYRAAHELAASSIFPGSKVWRNSN